MGASVFITIRMAWLMVEMWRAGAHRDAIERLQDEPDSAGKRRAIKEITRMYVYVDLIDMLGVFGDVCEILEKKFLDEEAASRTVQEYRAWLHGAGATAEDYEQGEKWSLILTQACESFRAFSSRGSEQRMFCNVADYADTWTENAKGSFTAYYVCRAGPKGSECDCMITSKDWARKFGDPAASRQKWYCGICGSKYRTSFGMVVQLCLKSEEGVVTTYLAQSRVPPKSLQDAKLMMVEAAFSNNTITPHELYAAIPSVKPVGEGEWLSQVVPSHYILVPSEYAHDPMQRISLSTLPYFDWMLLFKLCAKKS